MKNILIILNYLLTTTMITAQGVGLGTTTPDNKLQIVGGQNATLLPGSGYMTIGTLPNTNMVLDNNGIQVRNNGAAGNLRLQENGGNVYIDNPDATLYVRGTEDINLTDDEGLAVLGPTTGANIAIEIMRLWPETTVTGLRCIFKMMEVTLI